MFQADINTYDVVYAFLIEDRHAIKHESSCIKQILCFATESRH